MKKNLKYGINEYCIMVPVFYEYENKPAWRKMFVGNLTECEKEFSLFPDFLKATAEENAKNRKNQIELYHFFNSIGAAKEAQKIKEQYHF